MNRVRAFVRAHADGIALAAVLAFALVRGLVWIGSYPVLKIADEPAHFDNIQYRAEHHLKAARREAQQIDKVMNPTASEELRTTWSATNYLWRERFIRGRRVSPDERTLADLAKRADAAATRGQNSSIDYPGVYYTLAVVPYAMFRKSSVLSRMFAVRVYSLMWGLVLVACTFFCLRWCLESRALVVAGTLFATLQPLAAQQMIAINNDAGVFALCAVVFLLQLRHVRELPKAPHPAWTIALGIALALAMRTKPHAYGLVPGTLLVLAFVLRTRSRDGYFAAGMALLAFFVVYGWAGQLGGQPGEAISTTASMTPIPTATSGVTMPALSLWDFPSWLLDVEGPFADYLVNTAWGSFCWLEIGLEPGWFFVLRIAGFVFWLGVSAAIARRILTPEARFTWRLWPVVFSASTAVVGAGFLLALEFYARATMHLSHAIQGRAFLFVLPALSIVGMVALGSLVPRRFQGLAAALFSTGLLLLSLGALLTVVKHQYVG